MQALTGREGKVIIVRSQSRRMHSARGRGRLIPRRKRRRRPRHRLRRNGNLARLQILGGRDKVNLMAVDARIIHVI